MIIYIRSLHGFPGANFPGAGDSLAGIGPAPPIQHGAGLILTYRQDFGGEFLQIPSFALKWYADSAIPVTPDATPTLRIPITEHHVTVYGVTTPPFDAIRARIGAVNSSSFLGAAAGTMLFDGAKMDRVFLKFTDALDAAVFGWRLRYLFREKKLKVLDTIQSSATIGWNHCYRPEQVSGAHWDKLVDDSGATLYQAVSFTELFA